MQAADKKDAVIVAVTRDGQSPIWATTQVPADQLAAEGEGSADQPLDKTVFLQADSRARYEKVVDVVNNLRAAGVDQLGLLTEQIAGTPSGTTAAQRRRSRPAGQ